MIIEKYYKYIGYNGTILSEVLLPNVPNMPYVKLTADDGKILCKGNIKYFSTIVPESEKDLWIEIAKGTTE